jgi:hypothetical protein
VDFQIFLLLGRISFTPSRIKSASRWIFAAASEELKISKDEVKPSNFDLLYFIRPLIINGTRCPPSNSLPFQPLGPVFEPLLWAPPLSLIK